MKGPRSFYLLLASLQLGTAFHNWSGSARAHKTLIFRTPRPSAEKPLSFLGELSKQVSVDSDIIHWFFPRWALGNKTGAGGVKVVDIQESGTPTPGESELGPKVC